MGMRPAKTILLIEDHPKEARMIREMLNEVGARAFELAHVEFVNDAEQSLARHSVDIVLMELGLSDPMD